MCYALFLSLLYSDGMKYIERALEDASRINTSASDSLNEAAAFNETLSNMAKGIQNLEDANKKNLESINDVSKNGETFSCSHWNPEFMMW